MAIRETQEAPAITKVPVMEVLDPSQFQSVDKGEFIVEAGAYASGLKRDDGTPSKADDVLSMQENGSWQTRPAGTAGPFERCCRTTAGAIFRPRGTEGKTYLVAVAADAPNK